jgi:capsular exopolysaccharide synthesis family protein
MNYQPPSSSGEGETRPGNLVPTDQLMPAARDPYRVGAYGYAPAAAASEFQLDLLEYLRILIKRRWLIASIVAAALAVGAVSTLIQTPLYTSTARMQIDRNAAKIVEGGSTAPVESFDAEFMKTQHELLQSRTMAERVASALKLGEDPQFFQPRSFSIFGFLRGFFGFAARPTQNSSTRVELEAAAAGVVMGNRVIRPVLGSRLVDISYTDPDPYRAQKVAQAYADAFIASNLDKRFQANSYAKVFLEDQIAQLKARLEQSEKALLDFGQKEEIVQTGDKASIAEGNLSAANGVLGTLISERIKNEQLWKQVQSAEAINVPQLLSNPVIETLRGKRSALQTEYQQRLETYKPSYPAMMELSSQIADIDRQLAKEVQTLKSSYHAAYQTSLDQENEMKKRMETLKQEALDLQKRSIVYNIFKREVETNQSLYNGLLQRYKEVDIAGGVGANNIFVIDKATPGGLSSPNMSRALIVSLGFGLVAAFGLAFVLERLDDTLRSPEEVERVLGYAILGVIPKRELDADLDNEMTNPRSHMSEAYRSLCTALQLSTETGLPKTLLVSSAGPGEGKSTTCIMVARHFANIGLKVLLVDADLRKPSLHTKLNLPNATGLSNYLTGACKPPELLQKTDVPNLAFMASGPLPPNAADLLGSARLLSLFSVGLEVFDLIVVDSPPVMGLADAPLLSSAVAATVFVVGAGQVRTRFVRAAIKRLQFSRASLVGTVITRFDARSSYGYGYGYGYGYSYGYEYNYARGGRRSEQSIAASAGIGRPKLTNTQAEG